MTQKAAKDAIDAAEDDIKTAEDILNKVRAYMFRDVKTSNVHVVLLTHSWEPCQAEHAA